VQAGPCRLPAVKPEHHQADSALSEGQCHLAVHSHDHYGFHDIFSCLKDTIKGRNGNNYMKEARSSSSVTHGQNNTANGHLTQLFLIWGRTKHAVGAMIASLTEHRRQLSGRYGLYKITTLGAVFVFETCTPGRQ
jgi:hypothetical protein